MIVDVPMHHYELRHLQYEDLKDGVATGPYSMLHLQDEEQSKDYEFDWVVVFNQDATDKELMDFCGGDVEFGECKTVGHPDEKGAPLVLVSGTEARLEELIKAHPGEVDFVEPDMPVFTIPDVPASNDVQSQSGQWNLNKIGLSRTSATGAGVHIYVMDTGIRASHTNFGGRVVPTVDTVKNGGRVVECRSGDTSCARDDNGHGTHCAGTAAGSTFGVATQATIHAMKVCCGSGSNILGGLDYIATKAIKPAVMTMSLGSYSTPYSSKVAVDAVVASGVTVFVSAGNANIDSCQKSYTFIPSVIGIGASDSNDRRASFSNWGSCNAIYAPGVAIVSASHTSNTGSSTKSGTSMASPLAAGVGALLLQANPSLTPQGLRSQLVKNGISGVLSGLKTGDPNLRLNVV